MFVRSCPPAGGRGTGATGSRVFASKLKGMTTAVSVPSRAICATLKFCIPYATFYKSESVSFSGLFRVINFWISCNSILTPFLHGNHRNSAVFNEMLQYVH